MEDPKPPTTETLERWFDRFSVDKPDLPPIQGHWVDSLATVLQPDGMAICFAVRGAQPVTLFLNALVASALLQNIRAAGPLGGWMDKEDNLIVSDPSGRSRWRSNHAN